MIQFGLYSRQSTTAYAVAATVQTHQQIISEVILDCL